MLSSSLSACFAGQPVDEAVPNPDAGAEQLLRNVSETTVNDLSAPVSQRPPSAGLRCLHCFLVSDVF